LEFGFSSEGGPVLSIAQTKVGMFIAFRDEPYRVVYAQHTKMGRGGGILKAKIKNLISGAIIEQTFKDSDRIEEANLMHEATQFLYKEGETFYFMNNATYDQFELKRDLIGQAGDFLKDGQTVDILLFRAKPIGVNLPPKVDLAVTYTEPTVAGNTVSNVMKNATIETGATIKVPLFVKTGDIVKINTETGEYVERVR
jgi:elongation factor P